MQNSIETTATVGVNRHLILDEDLPAQVSKKVRVIILLDDDFNESDWERAASANEVFEFLADEGEDIYSSSDGEPLTDET